VESKPIIAVCGKGGVGKTVVSALLAGIFLARKITPLLLVDADPAGGLVSAIGERAAKTLAGVREALIASARGGRETEKERLARDLDYLVMEALLERGPYSLLAMGRMEEKGCYCPANALLREAIDLLVEPFSCVLIDAEAGLEQINRQVTRRVTRVIAVSDGSKRSAETIAHIAGMIGGDRMAMVANRVPAAPLAGPEAGVKSLGAIPEDPMVRDFDRAGRSLWELPPDNPALAAAQRIADRILEDHA
jgi:CO dehydrogenase maturation factor